METHQRPSRLARLLLLVVFALLVPSILVDAQPDDLVTWSEAFPTTLDYDLPAMTLPPDAFPVPGLAAINGRMLRPVEEAGAFAPVLGVEPEALLAELRATGWQTRYIGEMVRVDEGTSGVYSMGGWSSVALHEEPSGALAGFALLDESGVAGVEVVPMPERGDAARLTHYVGTDANGRQFERIRVTVVSGRLIGSVAFYWYDAAMDDALAPEALLAPMDALLARMDAVMAGEGPSLATRVGRFDPAAGLPIVGHQEGYYALDGTPIPWAGDTLASLEAAGEFHARWGVEANYAVRTGFVTPTGAPAGFVLVQLYRLGDSGDADGLVVAHATYDATLGYSDLTPLDRLPAHDGAIAGTAYTSAWSDGTPMQGYRIWLQVGATVVIVEASAPEGVAEDVMFAIVERQRACAAETACAPIPAPFGTAGSATPAA